jgi:flagellar biosynthesis protein FlhA
LVGGVLIGYTRGLGIADAARQYAILSIGDGLVSQIPSIIIAISSGFLVSKIRSENTLSSDMTQQMFKRNQPIMIAAFVISAFALVPGFPKIPFLLLGGCCGLLAYSMTQKKDVVHASEAESQTTKATADEEASVEEMLQVDILSILVGVRLINLVDPRKKSILSFRWFDCGTVLTWTRRRMKYVYMTMPSQREPLNRINILRWTQVPYKDP